MIKKEIASRGCSGVIYMYITILVKQVYWYISQVSGERLQDHWSSGSGNFVACDLKVCKYRQHLNQVM